jgi:tetratricopeptide (TPR) repeat protein
MKAGSKYFKQKKYPSAYKVWRKVGDKLVEKKLYKNPKKVALVAKLRYLIGFALFKAKKYSRAARYWRQTLSLVPTHKKALRGLRLLAKGGKISPREVSPDPDFPVARKAVVAPIKPPPVDPVGAPPKPIPEPIVDSLDILEGVLVKVDRKKAKEAWEDGNNALSFGPYSKAASFYRDAYRYGYDKSQVDYQLGKAFLKDEKPDKAVFHFQRVLKSEEGNREFHLALGKAYGLLDDVPKEIASYQRGIQIDDNYGEAHFMLALAYDKVKNSPKVLEHAQKAIRIDPEFKEKLKPRIKDSNVSKEIGKIVTNVLRDSKFERLTDEKIEEYAEEIGRILGEENLNTNDFQGGGAKDKVRGVLADIRDGKSKRDAVKAHFSSKERTQFLKAYRKSPKFKQILKDIKKGKRY